MSFKMVIIVFWLSKGILPDLKPEWTFETYVSSPDMLLDDKILLNMSLSTRSLIFSIQEL